MEIEKYSPKWLLEKLNTSKTDAHKLIHIIKYRKEIVESTEKELILSGVVKSLPNDDEVYNEACKYARNVKYPKNMTNIKLSQAFANGADLIKNHLKSEIDKSIMNEKEMTNLEFEFVKVYHHDQYRTVRYKKGVLEVEFTYSQEGLESCDLTIQKLNCLPINKIELKQLNEILNKPK